MPLVYNKRDKDIPIGAIYIGRPSKWGNKFKIGQLYQGRILSRKDVVEAYRDWICFSDEGQRLLKDIGELRGKDLICFCAPLQCHGDVLLELANRADDTEKNKCTFPQYRRDSK